MTELAIVHAFQVYQEYERENNRHTELVNSDRENQRQYDLALEKERNRTREEADKVSAKLYKDLVKLSNERAREFQSHTRAMLKESHRHSEALVHEKHKFVLKIKESSKTLMKEVFREYHKLMAPIHKRLDTCLKEILTDTHKYIADDVLWKRFTNFSKSILLLIENDFDEAFQRFMAILETILKKDTLKIARKYYKADQARLQKIFRLFDFEKDILDLHTAYPGPYSYLFDSLPTSSSTSHETQ